MLRDKFIEHITYERRLSPHTIKAYQSDLRQFYFFTEHQFEVSDITKVSTSIIRSWIVDLIENSLSTRSANRKLSTLKSYFKFLINEEIIEINPMQKVLSPKTSKKLPVFVEKESINTLLDEIEFGDDYSSVQDKLIIELFYATGIRLSELINIKLKDINYYNNSIKVLGKRNKERIIPVSLFIVNSIKHFLEKRNEENFSSDYLFLTNKGEKIYEKLVYRIVNTYLSKVTTLTKKSPHVLRHTFATHMLNNGAELNAIKEILGHSNLSATQVYTHNTIDKLKSIYKTAHPKA